METPASEYHYRIDQPCPENWSQMLPDEKGKFCNQCHKAVYDFTDKTPAQINEILSAHSKNQLCGRFTKEQLMMSRLRINRDELKALQIFAWSFLLAFGSYLFRTDETASLLSFSLPDKEEDKHDINTHATLGIIIPNEITPLEDQELPTENINPDKPANSDFKNSSPKNSADSIFTLPEVTVVHESITLGEVTIEQLIKESDDSSNISEGRNSESSVFTLPEVEVISTSISGYECHIVGTVAVTEIIHSMEMHDSSDFNEESIVSNPVNNLNSEKDLLLPGIKSLEIFPNPSSGQLQVKFNFTGEGPLLIEVINISGQVLKSIRSHVTESAGDHIEAIDLTDLPSSVYYLIVTTNKAKETKSFVILH